MDVEAAWVTRRRSKLVRRLQLWLPADELEAARLIAAWEDVTLTRLVRRALRHEVARVRGRSKWGPREVVVRAKF